jgi:hypothetical protein
MEEFCETSARMNAVGKLSRLFVPVVAGLCEGLRRFACIGDSVLVGNIWSKIRNSS